MKKRQLAALAAAAMMVVCMPTTAFAALGRPGQPASSVQQQAKSGRKVVKKGAKETEEETAKWQQEMLDSINKERKAAGLAELELDTALCKAAQVRAEECQKKYSHTRPDGRASRTAMDDQKISYSWWGENINEKQDTVSSTMKSWMASKGHKANILGENFEQVGFGRAKDKDGSYYWVQLFAKLK